MTMRTETTLFNNRLLSPCAEDAPQKEKNLRPECDAKAPTFLSAVYNQRYTREKLARRSKQSGRSMIEMLGVLAIIGVLTVGSITGYSKAMRRHLLNKQREQISYILSAVETNHDMINTNTPNLPGNLKPIFETLGWIPEEMIKENDNTYIYDVFKNGIGLYHNSSQNYMSLIMHLANDIPHEQCVNLYQVIKQYHSFLQLTEVVETNENSRLYASIYYGDKYCVGRKRRCIRDLNPANISELCQVCNDTEDNYCVLHIVWQ